MKTCACSWNEEHTKVLSLCGAHNDVVREEIKYALENQKKYSLNRKYITIVVMYEAGQNPPTKITPGCQFLGGEVVDAIDGNLLNKTKKPPEGG